MTRLRTRVLTGAGILAAALSLAGCQQQAPKITIQSGSFSTTITPSEYCFDAGHCRLISSFDLPSVAAGVDGNVLVDVPRDVADTGWAVTALSLNGQRNLGASGTIRKDHTYRVAANANNGNPFVVAVQQVRGSRPDASRWSFVVRVSRN